MAASRRGQAGFTLLELLIVMTLAGLLVTAALPGAEKVTEASHVDAGAAGLRSLWSAQRMYWLEHREYATTLRKLELAGLIDTALRKQTEPFTFAIDAAGTGTFAASAERAGSSVWDGLLSIDQGGVVSGSVRDTGGTYVITPVE